MDDFDLLNNQIKDFIKKNKMPYYRKIINLRILAETNKSDSTEDKIIYEYLSAILHRKDKVTIKLELKEKAYTEKIILSLIYSKYNIKLKRVPNDIMENFSYDDLTSFEKIAYQREEARINRLSKKNYKKKTYIEKEFDDIVHLNNRYFVSLNPYKFDIFSEHLYLYI